ncbi:MAG: polysaccharide biosynthesis protein [Syntrophotaleaceae bacterium]
MGFESGHKDWGLTMLKEKSILVTGGTGSFGKKFVETVLREYPETTRLVVFPGMR